MTANVKQPRLVNRCGSEANTGEKDGKTRAQENGVLFKRRASQRAGNFKVEFAEN